MYKILSQLLSCFIGSFLFGIPGVIIGSFIGGNFEFLKTFGGNKGYEAGGAFFAIIAFGLGTLFSFNLINTYLKQKQNYNINWIVMIIATIINLLLFDRNMPQYLLLYILLSPGAALVTTSHFALKLSIKTN